MLCLLVTGFEPFGPHAANPSGEAARRLHGQSMQGLPIVGLELPCRFDGAGAALHQALQAHRPSHVLALGLAPSRVGFSIERVALNLVDERIADTGGAQPLELPVLEGAAPALFATLPVKAMQAALAAAGHRAELSLSAGSYVCNHFFFTLMHALQQRPGARGGFMHVGADLDADAVLAGTRLALQAALDAGAADLRRVGGSID